MQQNLHATGNGMSMQAARHRERQHVRLYGILRARPPLLMNSTGLPRRKQAGVLLQKLGGAVLWC